MGLRSWVLASLVVLVGCGTEPAPAARLQAPAADQGCVIVKLPFGSPKLLVAGGKAAVAFCDEQTDAVLGAWKYTIPGPHDQVVCTWNFEGPIHISVIDDHESQADDDACGVLSHGEVP